MKTQISERVLAIIGTLLDSQNDKGFKKYKETLDDVPFMNYDWNVMVIEELIDAIQYMVKENERLKQELRESENGFDSFQEMSKRTMPNSVITGKDKSNYAMGVAGEAGELVDLIKKNVHHGHPMNLEDLRGEIGDVLHYLSGVATLYHISFGDCAWGNVVKLEKRYPNGFNTEDSVKRIDVRV